MKNIIKILLFSLISSALISLSACSENPHESQDDAQSRVTVILSAGSREFDDIGESEELTFTVYENGVPPSAEELKKEVKWSSTNPEVAIYDGKEVKAVGYGSCVIRITYKTGSATCTVNNPNPTPPLSISAREMILDNIGAQQQLIATSDMGADISKHVEWKTSNKNIATCEGGLVVAKGYGSCTVWAKASNQTVVCNVTVNNPTAPHVSMSQSSLKLDVGEMHTLTAIASTNAGQVTGWISSRPDIATCEEGVIVAKKRGACAILATTDLGYTGVTVVNVGDFKPEMENKEYLKFDFPDVGEELKYIDSATGNLLSKAVVTSYVIDTSQLLDDGRLVVEIKLECVKTYDAMGLDALTPAVITTDLYSENNVWRASSEYQSSNVIVGQPYQQKLSGFTVQTLTNGEQREFYMTFASITES